SFGRTHTYRNTRTHPNTEGKHISTFSPLPLLPAFSSSLSLLYDGPATTTPCFFSL
ncbi:hypothetical protein ACTXT7_006993, partial [Hymenolepis weldensis]